MVYRIAFSPRNCSEVGGFATHDYGWQEEMQMLTTILLVVLILMLVGALPTWG